RQVGQKFAWEIFFLGDTYDAAAAHRMGMVNAVVPHTDLEGTALDWAAKINAKSPTSQRMLKYAFNLIDDGLVGQQVFAAEATRLAYMTDEAVEGRDAFLQKRPRLGPLPVLLLSLSADGDRVVPLPEELGSWSACARASTNAMEPRIQRVLTPWNPGFSASGSGTGWCRSA